VAIKHLDGGIMYKLLGLKSLKEYIYCFFETATSCMIQFQF